MAVVNGWYNLLPYGLPFIGVGLIGLIFLLRKRKTYPVLVLFSVVVSFIVFFIFGSIVSRKISNTLQMNASASYIQQALDGTFKQNKFVAIDGDFINDSGELYWESDDKSVLCNIFVDHWKCIPSPYNRHS